MNSIDWGDWRYWLILVGIVFGYWLWLRGGEEPS